MIRMKQNKKSQRFAKVIIIPRGHLLAVKSFQSALKVTGWDTNIAIPKINNIFQVILVF